MRQGCADRHRRRPAAQLLAGPGRLAKGVGSGLEGGASQVKVKKKID